MRKLVMAAALAMATVASLAMAAPEKSGAAAQIRAKNQEFAASWNRHDPKAMAAYWAPDGDLINPSGRVAKGRAEVEKLLTDEQSTIFKGTTMTITNDTVRLLKPDVAFAEWDYEISGMHSPDGTALPTSKGHVNAVMVKKSGQWWSLAARPVSYLPPSGSPPSK